MIIPPEWLHALPKTAHKLPLKVSSQTSCQYMEVIAGTGKMSQTEFINRSEVLLPQLSLLVPRVQILAGDEDVDSVDPVVSPVDLGSSLFPRSGFIRGT